MSAETFTRWTCDSCGAQHEGHTFPPEWVETGDTTLCIDCQDGPAEVRALLARLAAAEREIRDWKTRWRHLRADLDVANAELRRVRGHRRRDAA